MSILSETQPQTQSTCQTRDGTRLAYEIHGRDSSRRVALIHSLAMDRRFWRPVAERLAETACVLLYDCRGHGASDKPKGPYTLELFADDLADLMDQLGWTQAIVGGASMGGSVALAFGIRHPSRAAALGLVDTTACYGSEAEQAWSKRANAAVERGLSSLVDFQVTRWFGEEFRSNHPDVVASCVETFLRNDVQAYYETCRMLGSFDLRAKLSGLMMTARIIVGEEDYATPVTMAEELKAGIQDSTLTVLAGARHLTPLEQPDRVASELSHLLTSSRN